MRSHLASVDEPSGGPSDTAGVEASAAAGLSLEHAARRLRGLDPARDEPHGVDVAARGLSQELSIIIAESRSTASQHRSDASQVAKQLVQHAATPKELKHVSEDDLHLQVRRLQKTLQLSASAICHMSLSHLTV